MGLREAMLKAGLVDQKQVAEVEKQKAKAEAKQKQKIEKGLHNRDFARQWGGFFGDKKPQLYFWMRDGKVPPDANKRCGICGQLGQHLFDAAEKVMNAMELKPGDSFFDMSDRAMAASHDQRPTILWPTTLLSFYADLKKIWPFKDEPVYMCGKCREDTIKQFSPPK